MCSIRRDNGGNTDSTATGAAVDTAVDTAVGAVRFGLERVDLKRFESDCF